MKTPNNSIEAVAPGETKLFEVHKHWFGLFIVYFEVAFGFVTGLVLMWLLSPVIFPNTDPANRRLYLSTIIGVVAIFAWVILILFTYIYRQNRLIVTNKNLTQILQKGLFNRKVSELSMANVEDVTANQQGFFPSVVGYGDMLVESAGAQENFDFSFCPKPNYYGKIVLDARQQYLDTHHG